MSIKRYLLDNLPFHHSVFLSNPRLLCYHSVSSDPDSLSIEEFREHCSILSSRHISTLDYLLCSSPKDSVCITFDDGHISFLNALEILQQFELPVTLFISISYLNSCNPDFLSKTDLISISKSPLVSIQSHGDLHLPSFSLSTEELIDGLISSKRYIEDLIGLPVKHFAAPYGKKDMRFFSLCPAIGYQSCCLGGSKPYLFNQSPYSIPRYGILPSTNKASLLNLLAGRYDLF